MSKKSRTFQPSEPAPGNTATSGTSPTPTPAPAAPSATPPTPTPPRDSSTGASRAEARRHSTAPRASAQQSFFERYRVLILGGTGVVVAIIAVLFFTRPGSSAYECVSFLTPPPAAADDSPAPSPLLGFQTTDLGREHAGQGASVRFDYCPPASGRHYNLGSGLAPLARRFYEPDVSFPPQHWIHNLEHGYVLLLYKGDPGTAALDELRRVMDEAPASTWNLTNCGTSVPNKVMAIRFDDMDPGVNFAAVSWDRALLQEQLDADELLAFAIQWQDGAATPERVCG